MEISYYSKENVGVIIEISFYRVVVVCGIYWIVVKMIKIVIVIKL